MTSALEDSQETPGDIPAYDTSRPARCPLDPAPALRARQAEAPLTRVKLWDGTLAWLVTGWAEHRAALSDPGVSVNPLLPGAPKLSEGEAAAIARMGEKPDAVGDLSFIMMDDPEHSRLRRMATGAFTIKRVEALRRSTQQVVDDLLDTMLAGPKPVDLVEAFALPVPSLVISALLGVPYSDHEFFQRNSQKIINRNTPPEERHAARGELQAYLGELVDEKLKSPDEDLLSNLAERIKAGELTRAEAVSMGVLMLFAGHETTANMITLGTLALLQHPDQLAVLRDADDPKVIASAVEELLRWLTIVHGGLRRVATRDIEIGGTTIKAGEGIVPLNEVANRDPEIFADPDRLDLTRDARRHVAFGFGVHQCLGQPLARMELQIAYPALLRRIPTLSLAADVSEIPFKHDGFVYGAYELPVTW